MIGSECQPTFLHKQHHHYPHHHQRRPSHQHHHYPHHHHHHTNTASAVIKHRRQSPPPGRRASTNDHHYRFKHHVKRVNASIRTFSVLEVRLVIYLRATSTHIIIIRTPLQVRHDDFRTLNMRFVMAPASIICKASDYSIHFQTSISMSLQYSHQVTTPR